MSQIQTRHTEGNKATQIGGIALFVGGTVFASTKGFFSPTSHIDERLKVVRQYLSQGTIIGFGIHFNSC